MGSVCLEMQIPEIPYITTPLVTVRDRFAKVWSEPMPATTGAWWLRAAERIALFVPAVFAASILFIITFFAGLSSDNIRYTIKDLNPVQRKIAEEVKERMLSCMYSLGNKKAFLFNISITLDNDGIRENRLIAEPRLVQPKLHQAAVDRLHQTVINYLKANPFKAKQKGSIDFVAIMHDMKNDFGLFKSTTPFQIAAKTVTFKLSSDSQLCGDFEAMKSSVRYIPGLSDKLSSSQLLA